MKNTIPMNKISLGRFVNSVKKFLKQEYDGLQMMLFSHIQGQLNVVCPAWTVFRIPQPVVILL